MVSEREGSHLTGFVGLTPSPRRVPNRQFTPPKGRLLPSLNGQSTARQPPDRLRRTVELRPSPRRSTRHLRPAAASGTVQNLSAWAIRWVSNFGSTRTGQSPIGARSADSSAAVAVSTRSPQRTGMHSPSSIAIHRRAWVTVAPRSRRAAVGASEIPATRPLHTARKWRIWSGVRSSITAALPTGRAGERPGCPPPATPRQHGPPRPSSRPPHRPPGQRGCRARWCSRCRPR
ncbi:MAG: hypothetical protein ACI8RZ_001213 [Myxococcota bacterium]|jgi:hypothetical protein